MIRRASLTSLLLSLGALCSIAVSQQQPPAFLQGVVVESGSDAPIGKAIVELSSGAGQGTVVNSTRTDSEGKFYLLNVAPGSYRLRITQPGHIAAEYGQRHPGGPATPLAVTPGQRMTDLRIAMTPGGVISGRITDKGQPIGLADVLAVRAVYTEGQLSFAPVLSIRVDDTGEYHLFWLPPGRYYIIGVVWDSAASVGFVINPDGSDNNAFYLQRFIGRAVFLRATGGGLAPNEAHVPIFYPGTPDPQLALAIDVKPGAVLRGIDIDASAQPTRRVRGRVVGIPPPSAATPQNAPPAGVSMQPLTPTMVTSAAQSPGTNVDQAGNFEIANAIPGRYVLTASAGNLTARTLLEVRERDITDVVISLSPGFTLPGRVVIDRPTPGKPAPALSDLRVVLRPDPILPFAGGLGATAKPDGSFTIGTGQAAIAPGDYRVLVSPVLVPPAPLGQTPQPVPGPLQNVYVKSIRLGDKDVLNEGLHLANQPQDPLTIVLGTNPGTLDGYVVNDRQQAVPATTVVLVHDNALRYRVNEKVTSSDASGRFEFQNVPPGNYKLFAWENIENGAWQDPGFMRDFDNRGVAVSIQEGGKASVNVSVIGQ